ncbi:hypothetical protein NC652_022035 [Populus alba x Populus x berolinensis]|nr:hypothetical protein NC652_022035 [Populus alba x Populus x berolinensis]
MSQLSEQYFSRQKPRRGKKTHQAQERTSQHTFQAQQWLKQLMPSSLGQLFKN